MKTKLMEAKYHEEKLQLQQKHDADVQKVGCVQFIICLELSIRNILGLVTIHPFIIFMCVWESNMNGAC